MIINILRTLYNSIHQKGNSHIIPNLGISYLKEKKEKIQNKNNNGNFTFWEHFMDNNINALFCNSL